MLPIENVSNVRRMGGYPMGGEIFIFSFSSMEGKKIYFDISCGYPVDNFTSALPYTLSLLYLFCLSGILPIAPHSAASRIDNKGRYIHE